MTQKLKLGEALVQAGHIDDFQLQSALGQQKKWGGRLGKALIELGFIDEATLIKFLSERLNYPAVDLSRSKISEKAFEALPKHVAEKYMAIPILIKDTPGKRTLVLAMADPTDLKALDEIEFVTNYKLEPYVALDSSIQRVLRNYGQVEMAPEKDAAIVLDDTTSSGPVEFMQGDMDMMEEVQKAYQTEERTAENAPGTFEIPPKHGREAPDAEPGGAFPGGSESAGVDFDRPFPGDDESESPVEEDDSPLEMIGGDDVESVENIEDADILEDLEPIEESEPAEEPRAAEDPYQFDPDASLSGEDELKSAEFVEDAVEAVEEAETAEEGPVFVPEADTAPAPDWPEVPAAEEITEAESVAEPESAKAEVAEDVADEELEAVGEVAGADEIPPEAAVAPEAAPCEAVAATEEEDWPQRLESCERQIEELRGEIRRLTDKTEGMISLFILHREGRLSKEEFLQELREL